MLPGTIFSFSRVVSGLLKGTELALVQQLLKQVDTLVLGKLLVSPGSVLELPHLVTCRIDLWEEE